MAEIWAVSGTAKYSGGTGEPNSPYRIATAADLNDISNHIEDYNKCFVMVNDINLAEYTGTQFRIIGDNNNPFTGAFDGNNQMISNFTYTAETGGIPRIGLFGYVTGHAAVIKNLKLTEPNVTMASGGVLVGYLELGTVSNSHVYGGNVHGTLAGGLVSENNSGQILDCSFEGMVTGNRSGGIVAINDGGTVARCYSEGQGDGFQITIEGGLIQIAVVGGLTGINTADSLISNCYSNSSVTAEGSWSYIGGLLGWNRESATVNNCYSTGKAWGGSIADIGGFVGKISSGSFANCFWDMESSEVTNGIGSGSASEISGKTTAEMQTQSTFADAGWDFMTPIWAICQGRTYPYLWYEYFDCEEYSGGDGSVENPYRIGTAEDLNTVGEHPEDWDKHFEMISDIDLGSYTGDSFHIIGTTADPFLGVFDGNNHQIHSFDYESQGDGGVGLFGIVGEEEKFPLPGEDPPADLQPVIKNVRLISPTVSGSCGGSLIVSLERGSCLNCYAADVNVTCISVAGGLIGSITDPNSVANCFVSGKVTGGDFVGGLTSGLSGGVSACAAVCDVAGHNHVGGLIGHSAGTGIHYCYSNSNVSGNEDVGGLTGSSGWGTIDNCYSVGSVYGNSRVGGLSGDLYECDIVRCYAACEITNIGGGLAGRATDSTVSASFWDTEVSGKAGSAGGTGKTTEQMQTASTYIDAGWDFLGETANGTDDVWRMCWNGGWYPRLTWQLNRWMDFVCPDRVDFKDLSYVAARWGQTGCADSANCEGADVDYSGIVDGGDVQILTELWLKGRGAPGELSVPSRVDFGDYAELAGRWLKQECWLEHNCHGSDLDFSGGVDWKDVAMLCERWLGQ
jgi:hypothetical protein